MAGSINIIWETSVSPSWEGPALPLSYRGSRTLAAEPGFEPGLRDPKSPVLPLHNSAPLPDFGAEGRTRTDTEVAPQRFLRPSRLPIPPLRPRLIHPTDCHS